MGFFFFLNRLPIYHSHNSSRSPSAIPEIQPMFVRQLLVLKIKVRFIFFISLQTTMCKYINTKPYNRMLRKMQEVSPYSRRVPTYPPPV